MLTHPLPPLVYPEARVLILGSFPSPASREHAFYYAHPRNRFWPVLAALFGEKDGGTPESRRALATRHGIALSDVIYSCDIVGASDASITHVVPRDIAALIEATTIRYIFTTGGTATKLYQRYCAQELAQVAPHVVHQGLPSTSPANARMSLDDLVAAYAPIAHACQNDL